MRRLAAGTALGMALLLAPGLIAPRAVLAAQTQGQNLDPTRQAQEALQAKGLYQGAIDGIAGPETRAAVSRFQAQAGLPVTGQLDARTLAALTGGGAPSSQTSSGQAPQAGAPLPTRKVQRLLRAKGFYNGAIDGIAGPETDAALRRFQRNNGLNVTGKPDAATLAALAPNQAPQAQAAGTGSQQQGSLSGAQQSTTAAQGSPSSGQGTTQSAAAPASPSQPTASSQAQPPSQASGGASAGSQAARKTSSQAANAPATQQPARQAAGASGEVGKIPGMPLPPGGLPPAAVERLAQAAPAAQRNGKARLPAHGPVLPPSVSAAQLPPSLDRLAR